MNIAICDDSAQARNDILFHIKCNGIDTSRVERTQYDSAEVLLDSYFHGKRYDIIFLDVEMNGISGVDAGIKIRKYDSKVIIIFISSYPKYAIPAYDCEAFYFIVKPIDSNKFTRVMNKAIEKYKVLHQFYIIKNRGEVKKLAIEEAKELGVRVLFGPVTLEESNPLNLTDDDYAKYINIIENELVKNYSEEKYDLVTGITSLSAIILQLITGRKKYYSCGVGTDQVGISATGKIYPCHRFIGINELEMGDIYTGIDKKLYGKYTSRFVDNINPCKTCWAKYLCGGGCAHESYTYNNDLFSPNTKRCDLTKNEIEIALKIYAEAMKNGEQEKLEKIAQVIGNNSVANAHIHNSHEVV